MQVLPEGLPKKDISVNRFRFGIKTVLTILVFTVLAGYIAYQFRFAVIPPALEVISPKENQVVSQSVTVFGRTEQNAAILVNDIPTTVEKDGTFKKNITLFPGKATIRIKAQNRFGKFTQIDRQVEVKE